MLKRKKVKPITLRDVTIIDDGKLRKAITAASLILVFMVLLLTH